MKLSCALMGLAALIALSGCASERARAPAAACAGPDALAPAAIYNAAAEQNLAASPFGRREQGWAIYAPMIARTVGSRCPEQSPGFARAVARWQAIAGLVASGGVDAETLAALEQGWEQNRPFVRLRAGGLCPAPPDEAGLVAAPAAYAWRGAAVRLRPGALNALEAMVDAARRQDPRIASTPEALMVFSAYRSPAYESDRCAREHNCDGIVRAACSSHRTGLAVDLALGSAPGFTVDSSADANRLYQTKTPAYRWLVANAARFGFVNYVFEPWHWEWTGEAP